MRKDIGVTWWQYYATLFFVFLMGILAGWGIFFRGGWWWKAQVEIGSLADWLAAISVIAIAFFGKIEIRRRALDSQRISIAMLRTPIIIDMEMMARVCKKFKEHKRVSFDDIFVAVHHVKLQEVALDPRVLEGLEPEFLESVMEAVGRIRALKAQICVPNLPTGESAIEKIVGHIYVVCEALEHAANYVWDRYHPDEERPWKGWKEMRFYGVMREG